MRRPSKDLVSFQNLIKCEAMGDQLARIDLLRLHGFGTWRSALDSHYGWRLARPARADGFELVGKMEL